jgi:hypothetical protein
MKIRTSIVLFVAVAALSIAPLCYAAPSCCEGQQTGTVGGVFLPSQGLASAPIAPQTAWNGAQRPRQAPSPAVGQRWVAPAAAARYVTPIAYGQPYAVPASNCCAQPGRGNAAPSAPCCGSLNGPQGTGPGSCCPPGAGAQVPPRAGCCGGGKAPCGGCGSKVMQRPAPGSPSSLPPCCVPGTADNKPAAIPAVSITGPATAYRGGPVRQGSPFAVRNVNVPSPAEAARQVGRPWAQSSKALW